MDRRVEAYISGQLGKALYKENGQCYIVGKYGYDGPVECDHWDISHFFDYGAEYDVVSFDNFEVTKLTAELNRSRGAHFCLSMMLCVMDEEKDEKMDEEIRRSSLGAALKYLDIDDNFNFVRNRLLCRLLPKGAEIVKAIEIAESLKAAKAITIYKEVERSQDIIRHILTVWSDVSDKMFQSKKESSLNEKLLIEAGVFAEMISAIESNDSNRLNLVVLTYGMKPDLRKRIPNIAHLLKAMIDGLRQYVTLKNIPVTADVSYDNEETGLVKEDRILNLILTHGKEMISGKKILAHEAISYVDRQIVTILDQVKQGDEAYAIDTMFNLIKFNVSQGDDEKTQRTLCRLAKDFLNINRTDFAGKCVEYAEAVPRVDAFIGTTKAIILKAKGLLDEALDVYNETIKLFPHDVVARNGKAEVLKELGQLDDALDVYNEAIKLFPHDVVAYCGKAQVLKELGQLGDALIAYDETIKLFPHDVVAYCGKAQVLKELGQLDDALDVYNETIKLFPHEIVAYCGRATVLIELGQLDNALIAYNETIKLFPHEVVAYCGKAQVLKELGQLDDALDVYNETIKLFPHEIVAHTGRAEVLKELGQLGDALIAYDETIKLFPHEIVAYCGKADVLKELGQLGDALDAYNKTIKLFPHEIVAYCGKAEVLKELGQLGDALIAYDETIKLFPHEIVAHTGRAEVLKELDQLDDALIAYNETIKLFPHEVVARNGKASLLILMDKLEDAVKYIKNDYPQSKEDWINYHISAMYYLKTGDITKAIKRLEYGYENVPFSNSRKYFEGALAFARIQNKEYDKAEKVLRCAIAVITVAAMNPKCLILLIHSQLERPDKRQEAIKHLAILQDAKNPIIITLRDNLWKMYDAFERQSDSEIKALRIEIIKKEELLVSA